MSEQSTALERLRATFIGLFHIDVPSADTDLLESGILDSLQLVKLLLQIEKDFGRRIPIEAIELDDLRTLARLARLVSAHARERLTAADMVDDEA
jgi:methoxymalonate biosynthesis acyl carrier protein